MMECELSLQAWRQAIDATLAELLPASSPLFEAARYSLLSAGKRLRPLLLLATADSYGIDVSQAILPACALEMIHTYSLIHDDLPCMDDDDLRRGRPTLHKVYPEWQALLAGDFLLTYAFEVLTKAPFSSEQRLQLVRYFAFYAGGEELIGGQTTDLLSQGLEIPYSLLEGMHRCKTASLITLALVSGGIIGNVCDAEVATLKQIGQEMGIAFQILDDILDHEGSVEELGKAVGSDAKCRKATAVSVLGVDAAKKRAERLLQSAQEKLSTLSCTSGALALLFDKMIHRKK